MTHSVCADGEQVQRVTPETAKRFLLVDPKQRDITPGFSYVYVIQAGDCGPVKIGHAEDPLWRMMNLQIGSWEALHLRAVIAVLEGCHKSIEAAAHKSAERRWLRGEWFRLEPLDAVACVLKAGHSLQCKLGTSAEALAHKREAQRAEGIVREVAEREVLRRKLGMD